MEMQYENLSQQDPTQNQDSHTDEGKIIIDEQENPNDLSDPKNQNNPHTEDLVNDDQNDRSITQQDNQHQKDSECDEAYRI